MLDIKGLACLQAWGSVRWEADSEELFQFVCINRIPIASIIVETNEDYVYFDWDLEWNLYDTYIHD